MSRYAMVLLGSVIDVIGSVSPPPAYPPDPLGNPVTAVLCDDTVELGMIYDSDTEEFSWPAYIPPEEDEETIKEPTQLDRIESILAMLTADTVTEESINTAISEGVNEV